MVIQPRPMLQSLGLAVLIVCLPGSIGASIKWQLKDVTAMLGRRQMQAKSTGCLFDSSSRQTPPRLRQYSISGESSCPPNLDWTELGAVTEPGDEGSCKACWASAPVAALESAHYIATGELLKLSVQQVIDCNDNADGNCSGGDVAYATSHIVTSLGVMKDEEYPYLGTEQGSCQHTPHKSAATALVFQDIPSDEASLLLTVSKVTKIRRGIRCCGLTSGAVSPTFPEDAATLSDPTALQALRQCHNTTYTVKAGDTPYSIARQFRLYPGMALQIPDCSSARTILAYTPRTGPSATKCALSGNFGFGLVCDQCTFNTKPGDTMQSIMIELGVEDPYDQTSMEISIRSFNSLDLVRKLLLGGLPKDIWQHYQFVQLVHCPEPPSPPPQMPPSPPPSLPPAFNLPPPRPPPNEVSLDWVKIGAVTKGEDHGSCKSCWASIPVSALESSHFLSTGVLEPLSVQQVLDYNGAVDGNCSGGDVQYAMQYMLHSDGLVSEADYPYGQTPSDLNGSEELPIEVKGRTLTLHGVPTNEEDLLLAVCNQPIVAYMRANPSMWQLPEREVYECSDCPAEDETSNADANAAVLVVGYGSTADNGDYWLIKGSNATDPILDILVCGGVSAAVGWRSGHCPLR
eukprot:gene12545-15763_t